MLRLLASRRASAALRSAACFATCGTLATGHVRESAPDLAYCIILVVETCRLLMAVSLLWVQLTLRLRAMNQPTMLGRMQVCSFMHF